jgi:hypothetical protein
MIDLVVSVATPKLAMLAHLAPHPCPRTGKCCGRCKLAIPGDAAHLPSLHPSAHGNESHARFEHVLRQFASANLLKDRHPERSAAESMDL